jgi:mannose-6-phosphate isomerase-like protein (cupin superfamily)
MVLRTVAALGVLAVAVSCATGGNGKGVLAPANPANFTPSPYQPERPFTPQSDGALARPLFRTDGAAPYRAEIRDVLVPPGKSTTLAHDGLVVVDTREGTGAATVQDRRVDLTPGATFGLSQGQTASVQNVGRTPLLLRVYIVTIP